MDLFTTVFWSSSSRSKGIWMVSLRDTPKIIFLSPLWISDLLFPKILLLVLLYFLHCLTQEFFDQGAMWQNYWWGGGEEDSKCVIFMILNHRSAMSGILGGQSEIAEFKLYNN